MVEINVWENRKTLEFISESKSWFFEETNKMDMFFLDIIKKIREKAQIHKIKDEKGSITMDME